MDGVEIDTKDDSKTQGTLTSSPTPTTPLNSTDDEGGQKHLRQLDSFEKLEAKIAASGSIDEDDNTKEKANYDSKTQGALTSSLTTTITPLYSTDDEGEQKYLQQLDSFEKLEAQIAASGSIDEDNNIEEKANYDSKTQGALTSSLTTTITPLNSTDDEGEQKHLQQLDSFEKLEAQIAASGSMDEDDNTEGKAKSSFCEDYTMKDGTYLDSEKPIETRTFDIIRDLETLEYLRRLEMENRDELGNEDIAEGTETSQLLDLDEAIINRTVPDAKKKPLDSFESKHISIAEDDDYLERQEVLELIKKAEERLLPNEKETEDVYETLDGSNSIVETATESQVIIPELVKLEKCSHLPDLVRMESSDMSEEEGYRQRLSCILEESESDTASLSSSIVKPVAKSELQDKEPTFDKNKENENATASISGEHSNAEAHAVAEITTTEISPVSDEVVTPLLDNIQEIATSINPELPNIIEGQIINAYETEEESKIDRDLKFLETVEKTAEADDSIDTPNTSPEPKPFGIQKLKSGNHVDKLLTRPVIIRRVESSSDSSLDLSTSLSTPIVETEPCNIMEIDLGPIERISVTPENVTVEMETSAESTTREVPVTCDITEITERDVEAMFPKMKKSKRRRSLESGIAEKISEENAERNKENEKLETKSHKGDENRPPVPPETYLWEELRRWRMKGGYPWTYLDKPPFDEKTWKTIAEHEYEPINPPPLDPNSERPRQRVGDALEERRFLRIPTDDELVVSPEDMEVEAIASAQSLQDELEGRFLATPMTGTTASRTDCDVNTSMLDSSGLEDLPLKRGSRTKKAIQSKTEQMRAQAQGIQQRLRSQAGKLRNKLKSIPRPTFPKKQEREKAKPEISEQSKPRFRLPERPKISLPERPKFNFPDKSKFKMPQKPKINLPNFTNPLRERQSNGARQSEPKKNIFDVGFKTYPRIFSKKSKERGEYTTSSPKLARNATPPPAPLQPSRKKGPVGQRWVNRFDDIKFVDDKESEMSESFDEFNDKDFAMVEDIDQMQLPPPRTLSTKSSLSHLSDRELASSRSSEDRLRKGVIEEIDSDQFFLRQKGISEEDIDMGKYLSEEIREAFKSSVVNALRQMDYDYEDGKEQYTSNKKVEMISDKENDEPLPPSRTRSLKKTQSLQKESTLRRTPSPVLESAAKEPSPMPARYQNFEQINTKVDENIEEQAAGVRKQSVEEPPQYRYENLEGTSSSRYQNVEDYLENSNRNEEENISEYYKSPPTPIEYQHYKVPRSVVQPLPKKRKSSAAENTANKKKQNGWVEVEVETSIEKVIEPEPPQPLQRRKSKKGLTSKQSSVEVEKTKEEIMEHEYIIPDDVPKIPPEAPLRTRSLSRGAKSTRSLAQEEEIKPIAPKRTSSKSIHSLGLTGDIKPRKRDHDTRSLHSLAYEDVGKIIEAPPKRTKSLSRGSRSFHSLNVEEDPESTKPKPPERNRSLSKGSRSFHSLVEDEKNSWTPQAPDRTRSLSRSSKTKNKYQTEEERMTAIERTHHYEAPMEYGYAVVDKSSNKPKPPRPPPPRRKRGSESPTFNTFPRKSPIRPIRAYATLGPSRPPRKSKPKPAQSVEHIYQSDQISIAYNDVEDTLKPAQVEDLHGSNKDLQTEEVIEKMKGRPLPAPPRPPRLKARNDEPISQSMEEVEEVCVSTQTDPLPDDLILEDDMIQEFSHENYKIQEAFLEAMREEEERIQRETEERKMKLLAMEQQIQREREEAEEQAREQRIEESRKIEREREQAVRVSPPLIPPQEERRLRPERRQRDEEKKKAALHLEAEDDMGYASLDRRHLRPDEEPEASTSFQTPPQTTLPAVEEQVQEQVTAPTLETSVPTPTPVAQASPVCIPLIPEVINTESLRVSSLEVDRLLVNELQANSLQVQDLRTQNLETHSVQGATLQIQDITSRSGQLTLGNIELPPDFLQQIIARIPWEELRPPQPTVGEPDAAAVAVNQGVVRRPPPMEEETVSQQSQASTTTHRRRHRHLKQHSSRSQYSSDEEDATRHTRRQNRQLVQEPNILEISRQLGLACTNAGFRAMRDFANNVRLPETEDRSQYVKAVVCVFLVAIVGYFLLVSGKDVHHHHWDFQFPPQPPKQ